MKIPQKVAWALYEDWAIVADYRTVPPSVYRLDGTAKTIWYGLANGESDLDIADRIAQEYEPCPSEAVISDVQDFHRILVLQGLIDDPGVPSVPAVGSAASEGIAVVPDDAFVADMAGRYVFHCTLELSYACNAKCSHCLVDAPLNSRFADPDIVSLCTIMDKLRDAGCMVLTLSGGEPLMRPDIIDILNEAGKRGFVIRILTNGTLISEKIANTLASLPVRSVEVSLFSADPAEHDRIAGLPGAFAAAIEGIDRLQKLGVETYVRHIVLANNARSAKALRRIAHAHGAKYVNMCGLIHPSVYGRDETTQAAPPIEDIVALIGLGIIPVPPESGQCRPATTKCTISPSGDIRPCEVFGYSLGNIHSDDLLTLWRSQKLEAFRAWSSQASPECTDCPSARVCVRCPAISYAASGDCAKPIDYVCRLSNAFALRASTAGRGSGNHD